MFDPMDHPRIQDLLEQAEQATQLLEANDTSDLRATLTAIHADLGKVFHGLVRQIRPRLEPLPEDVADGLGDIEDEDDPTAIPSPHDLMAIAQQNIASSVAPMQPEALTLTMIRMSMPDERANDLSDWLGLLAPGGDLIDPDRMPEEASKVQWASGELVGRLTEADVAVQAAVVGLLGCRARNVAVFLDIDIGPRMAMERLQRYRAQQDLPWVNALLPNARPELDSWAEDALAFWTMLTEP